MAALVEAKPPASRTGYGRGLAATCDQTGILRQIETTHFPDGKEIQVNGLLSIIKEILSLCGYHMSSEGQKEDPTSLDYSCLHSILEQLSTELAFTTLNAADVHPKTLSFFNMLSSYEWDAKLCLMLAALVTIYGDYWVLMQSCSGEQLAKDMVTLLQLKDRVVDSDEQKSWFDKLKNLIMSMVDLTEQIAKMNALLSSRSFADEATIRIATNTMVVASYWTVRNVVLCTSYMHSLFGKAYKSSVGPGDIDTMTKKISDLQATCQEMTMSLLGHVFVPAKMIKIVAWGGSGGKEWTYKPEGAITKISIVHGGAIVSITFSSMNPGGGVESPVKFGRDGGSKTAEVSINHPSEQLTGVSGTYGVMEENEVYVKSLKFHTNLREHGPFGSQDDGTPFSFVMENGIVVGFHGRSSEKFVDAIGVFVKQN
ncbi:PREDICTED: protein SIEVE ELEMENT OCCLUSION B-like [Ipomoea nil]|uniref:protein SIEVE ELEMENT OCCLUSION B-like n=1 Tax=Ipomoea nil TaxID=35883 RepID=UPI00090140C6|nr:PREDICTED: protein SIEVE ELEMENT OCCLUSION B-like [Ipomoea nil]